MTENGKLALCLVDDLLENLELRYTATVFRSESGFKTDRSPIEMRNKLGLEMDFKKPVLVQLLEKLNPTVESEKSGQKVADFNLESLEVISESIEKGSDESIPGSNQENSL